MSVLNTMLQFALLYQIVGVLKLLRSQGTTINYVPLAKMFGLFAGGTDLARILGLTQKEDKENGDPLLASLVVGVERGIPGKGYFECARQLKFLGQPLVGPGSEVQNAKDELLFWARQMRQLGVPYPPAAIAYAADLGVTLP